MSLSYNYNYGEEVSYSFGMLRPEDYEKLQAFSCGNDALDRFIHEDVIIKNARGFKVKNEDGLHFKIENIESKEIIGFVSLATSGIVNIVGRYIRTFPAVNKEAKRFYRRNGFKDFEGDMLKENNQEINGNSPMYYEL